MFPGRDVRRWGMLRGYASAVLPLSRTTTLHKLDTIKRMQTHMILTNTHHFNQHLRTCNFTSKNTDTHYSEQRRLPAKVMRPK